MKLFQKTSIVAAAMCLITVTAFSQENTPKDYLSKEFHAGRRQALRNLMPANSVAVIFAYPEQVFSNDVNYVYHQNPDLYYFSGYKEPDAALLIFKETQGTGDTSYNEVLFVRKRDAQREQWTGRRLGVEGAKAQLGLKTVYNSSGFAKFPINFKKFSAIIYDDLTDDASGDLKGLMSAFKTKAAIPTLDKGLMAGL